MNKLPSLEEISEPLNVKIYMNGKVEQKFSINFVDYHKVVFQEFIKREIL